MLWRWSGNGDKPEGGYQKGPWIYGLSNQVAGLPLMETALVPVWGDRALVQLHLCLTGGTSETSEDDLLSRYLHI